MKMAVSAMWLSESDGGVVALPFAGPQCAALAASSSQALRSVLRRLILGVSSPLQPVLMAALVQARPAPFVCRRAGSSVIDLALRLKEGLQSVGVAHV